jgi:aspartate kinase
MMSVTNRLLSASEAASRGDMKQVTQIKNFLFDLHSKTVTGLGLEPVDRSEILGWLDHSMKDHLVASCQIVADLGFCTGEKSDFISSLGERWSTAIMARYLESNHVPSAYVLASDILITDGVAGGATPDLELTKPVMLERLVPLLQEGVLPCVTGFIGSDRFKTVTTLGRGGSDLSAAVIGNILDANEVTMYKVESNTADDGTLAAWKPGWIGIIPKGSASTETIPYMSYEEATQLKKVLHPATCYPLMDKEIPIRVGNTLEYLHPGTFISNKPSSNVQELQRPWPLIVTSPPKSSFANANTGAYARSMQQRAFSTSKYKLQALGFVPPLANQALDAPREIPSPYIVPNINPDLIKPQDNGT